VIDEKTLRFKIIPQHGGESRLVFDQQDPRPVEVRYADIPHAADTSNEGDREKFLRRIHRNTPLPYQARLIPR
jgi:hypothetical protein